MAKDPVNPAKKSDFFLPILSAKAHVGISNKKTEITKTDCNIVT